MNDVIGYLQQCPLCAQRALTRHQDPRFVCDRCRAVTEDDQPDLAKVRG